jgi:hypothetical protein
MFVFNGGLRPRVSLSLDSADYRESKHLKSCLQEFSQQKTERGSSQTGKSVWQCEDVKRTEFLSREAREPCTEKSRYCLVCTGFDPENASAVACRGWFVGLVNHRTKTINANEELALAA